MAWDHRNIAETIHAMPVYETLRCEVGHGIDPYQNGGRTWANFHRWPRLPDDAPNPKREGHCLNCGKTLSEIRVRLNPKTGQPIVPRARRARYEAPPGSEAHLERALRSGE